MSSITPLCSVSLHPSRIIEHLMNFKVLLKIMCNKGKYRISLNRSRTLINSRPRIGHLVALLLNLLTRAPRIGRAHPHVVQSGTASYEWDEEDPFADCDTELEDDETPIRLLLMTNSNLCS